MPVAFVSFSDFEPLTISIPVKGDANQEASSKLLVAALNSFLSLNLVFYRETFSALYFM